MNFIIIFSFISWFIFLLFQILFESSERRNLIRSTLGLFPYRINSLYLQFLGNFKKVWTWKSNNKILFLVIINVWSFSEWQKIHECRSFHQKRMNTCFHGNFSRAGILWSVTKIKWEKQKKTKQIKQFNDRIFIWLFFAFSFHVFLHSLWAIFRSCRNRTQ